MKNNAFLIRISQSRDPLAFGLGFLAGHRQSPHHQRRALALEYQRDIPLACKCASGVITPPVCNR